MGGEWNAPRTWLARQHGSPWRRRAARRGLGLKEPKKGSVCLRWPEFSEFGARGSNRIVLYRTVPYPYRNTMHCVQGAPQLHWELAFQQGVTHSQAMAALSAPLMHC